ncbi:alpha/beta fold hydrolase [Maricurvus nonylphenolicus]|uniref:alpha/beta fold hydrolase n=1 Tax=Maricurvus nonylphenolicus TaxID=1008307 RepID=UPI0036F2FE23
MTMLEMTLWGIVGAYLVWRFARLPVGITPLVILINGLSGFVIPKVHTGRRTPAVKITDDMRYPVTTPPPNTGNLHGEIEYLDGDIPVTHWYQEARGSTYHFVTAGDPAKEAILIVPGLPESWWAFHHQIADLSQDYYVVAIDMKGYGQSDKRLHLDYTNPGMALDVAELMDKLEIDRFNIMGHDRGTVLTDHLTNVPTLKGRIIRYVRMQQSFNEPHGEPVPPHHILKTKFGAALFKSKNFIPIIYQAWFPSNLSDACLQRLEYEFKFKGTGEAISKYFETTNFDIEIKDREDYLFKSMDMPMLMLQAWYDRGQHPEEYDRSPEFVADARVQFIHANHFLHLENPVATNRAIRRFFAETTVSSNASTEEGVEDLQLEEAL